MRSLITTLTAGVILAGTLGLSTTGAAAYQPAPMPIPGDHYLFDNGYKGDFDRKPGKLPDHNRPGIHPYRGGFIFNMMGKPFCAPVYAEKWLWSPWSGWYLTTVKVDEKCSPLPSFRVAPPTRW
jgi:hypothetical protein